jgi:tetratricopeptide (TPR) repeat protein
VLGEVQLYRGQPSQALTDFNRALRSFQTLHARRAYAQTAIGAGTAHWRRGAPRKADDLFAEALEIARELDHPALLAAVRLGQARLAHHRGHGASAEELLADARKRFAALGANAQLAATLLESARLSVTRGFLDRAREELDEVRSLAGADQVESRTNGSQSDVLTVQGAWALALGRLGEARDAYREARAVADASASPYASAEAAIGLAEAALQSDYLQAAVAEFNRAAELARNVESREMEALANVGLGRVLLRRELWDEAVLAHQEMVARFREFENPNAQALALVGIGEARRNLDRFDEAQAAFETAAQLYAAAGAPQGEAAAAQGEARVLVERGELDAAEARYGRAIELTEKVGRALTSADDRRIYFDGRPDLYAEAICVAAQRHNLESVRQLGSAYSGLAGKAGTAAVVRRLREYEAALPTRASATTDADAAARNKEIQRLLAMGRDALL